MKLYHGSNTGGVEVLEPRLADHDRPYVYLTTIDVVAAIYLCNAVDKPDYWFPYGFDGNDTAPVYHELYPDALREVSDGVSGYIYEVEADDSQLIPLPGIPCARLAAEPVRVTGCTRVENAWELFQAYVEQGKLRIGRYANKSGPELERWDAMLVGELEKKNLVQNPECSYARFIKEKFPQVWEAYAKQLK